jgi:hypothetical protein
MCAGGRWEGAATETLAPPHASPHAGKVTRGFVGFGGWTVGWIFLVSHRTDGGKHKNHGRFF